MELGTDKHRDTIDYICRSGARKSAAQAAANGNFCGARVVSNLVAEGILDFKLWHGAEVVTRDCTNRLCGDGNLGRGAVRECDFLVNRQRRRSDGEGQGVVTHHAADARVGEVGNTGNRVDRCSANNGSP